MRDVEKRKKKHHPRIENKVENVEREEQTYQDRKQDRKSNTELQLYTHSL